MLSRNEEIESFFRSQYTSTKWTVPPDMDNPQSETLLQPNAPKPGKPLDLPLSDPALKFSIENITPVSPQAPLPFELKPVVNSDENDPEFGF